MVEIFNMTSAHCVIGSGPAGVACAQGLLARGANVLMLDAGIELESDRATIIRQCAATPPTHWSAAQLATVRGGLAADARGVSLKLIFGSDFPYRETAEKIPWRGSGVGLKPSLALGGLSNVWGAAMLPHCDEDINDWPIRNSELAPHYSAVLDFTGLTAIRDDLEESFPLHCEKPDNLPPSRQAERLLQNLQKNRQTLRDRGWQFGRSRLALRAEGSSNSTCIKCGMCMYGCAYGSIYNAADTVQELRTNKNFTYQRDVVVTCVHEQENYIVIKGFHRETREPLVFTSQRVYLAAGVIPSAQILLRSQSAYDQPLTLRDCQYFLFPLILARRTPGVQTEEMHTLSQLFIELNNPKISRRNVHLQFYTYSDLIGQVIRQTLGPLKFLGRYIDDRMVIVQGYLHSDESPHMTMTLKHAKENDILELAAHQHPDTNSTVKRVVFELLSQASRLGGLVLPPMLKLAEPGRSFHSGGSLPMRASPGRFETDTLGRPFGWDRLHVVDASVLPSIPATTITFSVMANAHRIGWATANGSFFER